MEGCGSTCGTLSLRGCTRFVLRNMFVIVMGLGCVLGVQFNIDILRLGGRRGGSWRTSCENGLKGRRKFEQASEEEKGWLTEPEVGLDLELEGRIRGLKAWCDDRIQQAKEHGDVAMNRAKEAGREWIDGDGV